MCFSITGSLRILSFLTVYETDVCYVVIWILHDNFLMQHKQHFKCYDSVRSSTQTGSDCFLVSNSLQTKLSNLKDSPKSLPSDEDVMKHTSGGNSTNF